MKKAIILLLLLALAVASTACAAQKLNLAEPGVERAPGAVVITFDFRRQPGTGGNQFAVWIEDAGGGFVKTLYATRFTAAGGWKRRPASIPVWVEKSALPDKTKEEIDAITGATPATGRIACAWDCTDASGARLPAGAYRYFIEGNMPGSTTRVLFAGSITIGGEANGSEATAAFFGDGAEAQTMFGPVSADYLP
jgi:hypothetical protein